VRVFQTVASSPDHTVSHYLTSLTNSFWHSYHFSVRHCPFTQISLMLKEQPLLATRQASVWKEEV